MRKFIFALRITCLFTFLLMIFQPPSAQIAIVKGTVKDVNGDPLSDVFVTAAKKTAITDSEGNYSLKLPPGRYSFVITYVSLSPLHLQVIVNPKSITRQNFRMSGVTELPNVTVVGSLSRNHISKLSIPIEYLLIPKRTSGLFMPTRDRESIKQIMQSNAFNRGSLTFLSNQFGYNSCSKWAMTTTTNYTEIKFDFIKWNNNLNKSVNCKRNHGTNLLLAGKNGMTFGRVNPNQNITISGSIKNPAK